MPPKSTTKKETPAQSQKAIILFNKKWLIRELGRGPLDNRTINAFGRAHFRTEWGGCWASDTLPLSVFENDGRRYYVLNTGKASAGGVHWLGLYAQPRGPAFVYDSFARNVNRLTPSGLERLRTTGRSLVSANRLAEQKGDSAICGQLSLAWLLGIKDYGPALMVEGPVML